MGRVYFSEKGEPYPLPVGREDGKRYRSLKYVDPENTCPVCGFYAFYTKTGKCCKCALDDAADFFDLFRGHLWFEPHDEKPGFIWTRHKVLYERLGPIGDRVVPESYEAEINKDAELVPVMPSFSLRDAIEKGHELWISPKPCSFAGHRGVRTLKNECYFCKIERETKSSRQAAISAGETWYTPTEPCKHCGRIAPRNVHNGQCKGCKSVVGPTMSPRQIAIAAGESWYTPDEPCKYCGQIAERNIHNGQCKGCQSVSSPTVSPRQAAISAGETWYTPTEPCKRCGRTAPRNVHNGQCKGCLPSDKPDRRVSPDLELFRNDPNLIISKADASAMGLKLYRTGQPCKCGHTGPRYVSTGTCVECLRGKP